jgi:ABC-type phosphate transport system substrate-binding protein
LSRIRRVLAILSMVLPLVGAIPSSAADQTFVVVVHPDVAGEEISRQILSAIFTRRAPAWEDGVPCQPVDQSMSSPLRAAFSEAVLEIPVAGVRRLWQGKISEGVEPPPVKASDQAVLDFVKSTKGAIGYVSADVAVPPDVKKMVIID